MFTVGIFERTTRERTNFVQQQQFELPQLSYQSISNTEQYVKEHMNEGQVSLQTFSWEQEILNGAGTTSLFDVTLTERFLLNSYLKESSLDSALTVLFNGIFCGVWNAFSLIMQHVVHEQWTDDIMQNTY